MKQFNLGILFGIVLCIGIILSINPEMYSTIVLFLTDNLEIAQAVENIVTITYNTTWFTVRIIAIIVLWCGLFIPYFFVLGKHAEKNIKNL